MKRFLPIFLVLTLVLFCLFFSFPSASAAGLDYNDFVTNVVVDGDNDLVTVSLPVDQFFWRLSWNDEYVDYYGNSFTHTYYSGIDYTLGCFSPFIDSSQIPDGTSITLTFDMAELRELGYNSPTPFGNVYYSNGQSYSVQLDYGSDIYQFNSVLDYNGADSFRVNVGLNNFSALSEFNATPATSTLRSCTMQFSISSLLRLQQATGKTNNILQSIQDSINNPASPVVPEGDSVIQDSIRDENELLNDAKDKWQQSAVVFDSAETDILLYGPAFLAVSGLIDLFVGIPFIQTLLQVSLSLGIVAVVLSIAVVSFHRSDGHGGNGKGGKQ